MTQNISSNQRPLSENLITENEMTALDQFDYVRFTFADINGLSRSKTVPKEHVKEFLKNGISLFAGSLTFGPRSEICSIKEIEEMGYSNVYVRPMSDTLHSLPWADSKLNVGEFLCETFWIKPYRNGSHQSACPRYVARKQLDRLFELGYELYSTFEAEFCVYEKDLKTPLFPGNDIFSNLLMDRRGNFLYEIERNLRKSGVDILLLQTEYGAGQFEIALQPTFGISGADQMFRFKDGVKAVSYREGHIATFMTKPNIQSLASGMHYNHSLWTTTSATNAFYDSTKPDGLSNVAKYWIGGLVKHARAITALCCPTLNCYRRLHNPFAPSKANWGIDDRKKAFRIKNLGPKETYVENRLPSSAANPYLVLAVTVAAGIDGIIKQLECPTSGQTEEALTLGKSLEESLSFLENDEVITESLGEEFVRWFTTLKREVELNMTKDFPFDSEVSFSKEKELYFEFI